MGHHDLQGHGVSGAQPRVWRWPSLLLVPAWDFDVDGWLHGRMAILRGVESGFSIVRAPKQGILTVTDDRGRVLAGGRIKIRAIRFAARYRSRASR